VRVLVERRAQGRPRLPAVLFSRLAAALVLLACSFLPAAEVRPYIGYVYPAGGRQGTTIEVRLGGQGLAGLQGVLVTGAGVTAKISDYYRRLDMEELDLLNEQVYALRFQTMSDTARMDLMRAEDPVMMADLPGGGALAKGPPTAAERAAAEKLMGRIERRTTEFNSSPASEAIASLVIVELKIDAGAAPGEREVRLVTARGVSNPLVFHVGGLPEVTRPPMGIAHRQVLGKEAEALEHEPGTEVEDVVLPTVINGQIASGRIDRYHFEARRGQHLVFEVLGRGLVPYLADAVPGWFEPIIAVNDAQGREVGYSDHYRFKPDPTLLFEVPEDGDYTLSIHDSLYRGREDFVYRITAGEIPFVTSVFPSGDQVGAPVKPEAAGWNLQSTSLTLPPVDAGPGVYSLRASAPAPGDSSGSSSPFLSSPVLFARQDLPEILEREPNNTIATAQPVTLPVVINGRIGRPGDEDVFQFTGKAGETVVAEVVARRLDSPLDSIIRLTDERGRVLAFNDDHEDLGAGLNTHHADSYLMVRLPADGRYCLRLADVARQGGPEYVYRLRLSAPRPDFELRVVPSSLAIGSEGTNAVTIYALRKDGFAGAIELGLAGAAGRFSSLPATLPPGSNSVRLTLRAGAGSTAEPECLVVQGVAREGGRELTRAAVPAEDRMQAFLWRHLLPARELRVLVYDPRAKPAHLTMPLPRAIPGRLVAVAVAAAISGTDPAPESPLVKAQMAGKFRALQTLFDEDLLTKDFVRDQLAEIQGMK